MKKVLLTALVLVSVLIFSLGAYGFAGAEEIARPSANANLSAEWLSFQFELEGQIYTLPVLYSELEANGWVAQNEKDLDDILEVGQYTVSYTTLINGSEENTEISVQFANLSDGALTMRECYVSGIQFYATSWNENTTLYFPGGFALGNTLEEVKTLYGEPETTQEYSTTTEWKYSTENYNNVILTFTNDTGVIEKMRMSNAYLP